MRDRNFGNPGARAAESEVRVVEACVEVVRGVEFVACFIPDGTADTQDYGPEGAFLGRAVGFRGYKHCAAGGVPVYQITEFGGKFRDVTGEFGIMRLNVEELFAPEEEV